MFQFLSVVSIVRTNCPLSSYSSNRSSLFDSFIVHYTPVANILPLYSIFAIDDELDSAGEEQFSPDEVAELESQEGKAKMTLFGEDDDDDEEEEKKEDDDSEGEEDSDFDGDMEKMSKKLEAEKKKRM